MPEVRKKNVTLTNVVYVKSGFDCKSSKDSGLDDDGASSSSGGSTKVNIAKSGPAYYIADSKDVHGEKHPIAVIGSGEFGRALSRKIAQSGYAVYIGSRNPEKCQ